MIVSNSFLLQISSRSKTEITLARFQTNCVKKFLINFCLQSKSYQEQDVSLNEYISMAFLLCTI